MLRRSLLCLLALLTAYPCFAQTFDVSSQPAVSQVNGKVSLEGGTAGAPGRSSALGMAEGAFSAPLGHSFGLQVDGLAATSYSTFVGGAAAHIFWRDPQIGLFGPVAGLASGRGRTVGWYGAEGEVYAPLFTISGHAGYQDAGSSVVIPSGGFYIGRLTVYPIPDLALTAGGGQFAGRAQGVGRIEYQPGFVARHNLAFFVDGSVDDSSSYAVTGGVRIYFGPDKTLIRRHREDDPQHGTVTGPATGVLLNGTAGGNGGSGGILYGNGGAGGAGL
jgi:hypothetical protein